MRDATAFLRGALTRPSRATGMVNMEGINAYKRDHGSVPPERRNDDWTLQHERRIAAHAARVMREAPPHERPGSDAGRPKLFSDSQLAAMRAEYAALPRHPGGFLIRQGFLQPFCRRWGISNHWIAKHLRNAA